MFWGYPGCVLGLSRVMVLGCRVCYGQRASELLVYNYIVYDYHSIQSTQDVKEVIFGPVKKNPCLKFIFRFFDIYRKYLQSRFAQFHSKLILIFTCIDIVIK